MTRPVERRIRSGPSTPDRVSEPRQARTATSWASTLHRVSFNFRRRSPSKTNQFQPKGAGKLAPFFCTVESSARLCDPVLKLNWCPLNVRSFSHICPNDETYRNLYKQSNIPEHLPKGILQFRHKSLILVYIFPLAVGSSLATGISALNRHSLQTLNTAFPTRRE